MRRILRRLCYGIQKAGYERAAGIYLVRALLFGLIGLWLGTVAIMLVVSLVAGWHDARWLAILIALGWLGIAPLALIQGFVQPAHQRYTLHHRRSNGR